MSSTKFSGSIFLIFLSHIGICTLSLYFVSERFVSIDINYDNEHLSNAIFGVAASALVISAIFARASFSFGYFAGLYFSTSILGFVWLSYFSQFPYDHQIARISAVVSLITFLIPALWSPPSRCKRRILPSRFFLWIPPSMLFVGAVVLAWALFYGWTFASLIDASNMRSTLPETPTLLRYGIQILTGALLPFALACYFFSRKWIMAAVALCLIFGFYPVTLSKIVVLSPIVMIFFWLLAWVFGTRAATVLSMTIPTLIGLIAWLGFDKIIPFGLINLRFMAVPASALDHYNDFFSSHDVTYFCQMSFVTRLFGCLYDEPLSVIMERAYHLGNYNASLFSTEALASVGIRFAPLAAFCCGLIFALGNWASQKLPPSFILMSGSVVVITLLNVPLSTTLLSNGGAFLLLLWYVTPAEFFVNNSSAYDLDAASRAPGISGNCRWLGQRVAQRLSNIRGKTAVSNLVLAGILVAGSAIFYETQYQSTRGNTDAANWVPLTATQQSKLFVRLRGKPKITVLVVCPWAECSDLANSFVELFGRLDWSVTSIASIETGTSGILIQLKSEEAIELKAAIDASTGLSAHLGVAESAGDLTVAIRSRSRETN